MRGIDIMEYKTCKSFFFILLPIKEELIDGFDFNSLQLQRAMLNWRESNTEVNFPTTETGGQTSYWAWYECNVPEWRLILNIV